MIGFKHMLINFKRFFSKYHIWSTLLIPLGIVLVITAKQFPAVVEQVYSKNIYPLFVKSLGTVTSLLHFSLGELLIILLFISIVVLLIIVTVKLIKHKLKREYLLKMLCKIASYTSIIFFAFIVLCGLNYYRFEFAYYSGLEVKQSSVSELASLCKELVATANEQRKQVLVDSDGITMLSGNTSENAKLAMSNLSKQYEILFDAPILPKSVINSKAMSHMNITGIFFPFTLESNVNTDIVEYNIPATMCHELAHTRGFMREDEANFIGYLACRQSDNIDFNYSGTMLALVHSMNRLATADYESFVSISQQYSDEILLDLNANSEYWKQYEGVVAEVSSKVNDTYLKANSQTDGVQGYGRMVDLLLADYRSRHNIS